MRIADLVEPLGLSVRTAAHNLGGEVTGGYASDLLSDVLAHSQEGNLWVTLQTHQNIVAVACTKGLVGILLVGGREPQEDTVDKAEREGLPILASEMSAFELIGRLYQLGVRGRTTAGKKG